MSSLIEASQKGDIEQARELLREGIIDINHQDFIGYTALIWALQNGKLDVVSLLLEAGADVNCQSHSGQTALICALMHGNLDIVYKLLEADADINRQDYKGKTALIIAIRDSHFDIVYKLLEMGADLHNNGYTELMYATSTKIKSLLLIIQDLDKLDKIFLEKLFRYHPYFWTVVSKRYSQKTFLYFVGRYSKLLNLPRDIVQNIF